MEKLITKWPTPRKLRILAYIKSSPGNRLLYNNHDHIHVSAYYVGNRGDRKSHTG